MPTTINREAYAKLIAGDLAWLEQQPRTLEREHIAAVLRDSIARYAAPPVLTEERWFPLQADSRTPGPLRIPWSVAVKAYGKYGPGQTLDRLAERGGFSWGEMDDLYPAWRAETDELLLLRAEVRELRQRLTAGSEGGRGNV
jgi:hypothetical protein